MKVLCKADKVDYKGAEDVEQLQRVVALKGLGFSLEEIRRCLQDEQWSLRNVLERRREKVIEDLRQLSALHAQIEAVLERLRADEPVTMDVLLQTIERLAMIDKYYTPEQQETLKQRREELGEAGMREAQEEWQRLIAAVRAEMERGTDPADPKVQDLAARWQQLIEAFTGGDPGIRQSLNKLYEEERPERASRGMVDTEVMTYIHKAMSCG